MSETEPSNAPGDPIDAVPRAAEAAARSIWPDTSISHLQAALLVDAGDKTLHATECPGADTLGLEGMVGRDWREVFAEFDEIEIESDSSPNTAFFLARESSRIAEPGAAYRVRTWGTAPAAATPGGSFVLIEAIGDPAAVRELIYHERMAALGQIAAGVAHEVNNSLTIVSGWLQILLLQVDRQDKILAPLRLMKEEVGRIASIIHRLLSFGRRTPVEQQLVRVNRLLADVLGLVEYQIRNENIEVRTELCPNLPMVMGDPNQLKQVFLNIIVNARQAMPDGGALTLTTGVTETGAVEIALGDTGAGIPDEVVQKIFNPFYTTKGDQDSSGIGLFLCRNVVKDHGGALTVSSRPGEGSTFIIRLPAVQAEEQVGASTVADVFGAAPEPGPADEAAAGAAGAP